MTTAADWAGRTGEVWAEEWRRTDRSFAPVDAAIVAAVDGLDLPPEPRLLDIGCGAGATSLALAHRLQRASVTGIDLSAALIAAARVRDAGGRARFIVADAGRWTDATSFDLLVSRHGVMFFDDPRAAFGHLHNLAHSGASLVFSCFDALARNQWVSALAPLLPPSPPADPGAPGPFAFADRDFVAGMLAEAGWRDAAVDALDYDYVAGAGDDPVADAVAMFGRIGPTAPAMRSLDGSARERLLDGIARICEEHRRDDRVIFDASAWIWKAIA